MKHKILGLFRNWIFFTSLCPQNKMTFRKPDFFPSSDQRVKSVIFKWALWNSPMTITRMVTGSCFVVDPNVTGFSCVQLSSLLGRSIT